MKETELQEARDWRMIARLEWQLGRLDSWPSEVRTWLLVFSHRWVRCVRSPANGSALCLASTVTCPNDALPGPAGGGANAPTLRTRDRCQEMAVRTAA